MSNAAKRKNIHDLVLDAERVVGGAPEASSERGRSTAAVIILTQIVERYRLGGFAVLVDDDDLKAMPRMPYGGYCAGIDKETGSRCKGVVKPGGRGYLVGSARGMRDKQHVLCSLCGDELASQRGLLPFFA